MFNTTEQGLPAMERRFRDAQQGDELFHRNGQTGPQVVQLPNRESDADDFDQFGRGEIRCRDFAGWAMHAEVDHAAGFIAPPPRGRLLPCAPPVPEDFFGRRFVNVSLI